MIDLKGQFGGTYQIETDESATIAGQTAEERLWLYQIPCRFGHIYVHGYDRLAVYCNRNRLFDAAMAIPTAKLLQRGDREFSVSFDPAHLEQAAKLLEAKRRRRLSEGHRAKLIEAGARHRFSAGSNA